MRKVNSSVRAKPQESHRLIGIVRKRDNSLIIMSGELTYTLSSGKFTNKRLRENTLVTFSVKNNGYLAIAHGIQVL